MKLEHFALNVAHPVEMTAWYVANLGMKIASSQDSAPFTHFLADDSGRIMIEIYSNESAPIPEYSEMDPLIVHLAFVSENPANDAERLIKAGAVLVSELKMDNGSHLIMLRDPWGLALQLCKRGTPMLTEKEN